MFKNPDYQWVSCDISCTAYQCLFTTQATVRGWSWASKCKYCKLFRWACGWVPYLPSNPLRSIDSKQLLLIFEQHGSEMLFFVGCVTAFSPQLLNEFQVLLVTFPVFYKCFFKYHETVRISIEGTKRSKMFIKKLKLSDYRRVIFLQLVVFNTA